MLHHLPMGFTRAMGKRCMSVALLAFTLAPFAAANARELAEVLARGSLSLCASADSLPYAANNAETPGFQIEIARAIAGNLKVALHTEWIASRRRANVVDCDILLDTILDPEAQAKSLRVSQPYHISGVALAFARNQTEVAEYRALPDGLRVGVMMNSLASQVVSRTGAAMVPFGFEEDLVAAVASGSVGAGALSTATIGYHNLRNPGAAVALVHAEDAEPSLRWQVAVGMRRADDALVAAINEALAALLNDGSIAAIYRRYGIDHRRP